MNCPKCQTPLQITRVRETQVDACPQCGGVWFDEMELGTIMGLAPSELRPLRRGPGPMARDRQPGICPRDGSSLSRVAAAVRPEVVVDVCPNCRGIWLDAGELDLLRS